MLRTLLLRGDFFGSVRKRDDMKFELPAKSFSTQFYFVAQWQRKIRHKSINYNKDGESPGRTFRDTYLCLLDAANKVRVIKMRTQSHSRDFVAIPPSEATTTFAHYLKHNNQL